MPRLDGKPSAGESIHSPRQYISREDADAGLAEARRLIRLGCAVFVARPARDRGTLHWDASWGHGGSGYWLPEDWESTPVSLGTLDRYQYGDALGLVTGHALDVLDVDPRNGGDDDFAKLVELGLVPTAYAVAATPSGGVHLFTAPHGVRKTKRGGLDLQAGDAEGNGRGFVWIAPTVRRSKVSGQVQAYRWVQPLTHAGVGLPDDSARALVEWFHAAKPTTSTADEHHWNGDTDAWLATHTTGKTLSRAVARAVQPFIDGEPFDGHHRMLKFQIYLVRLAAEGHNGVPEALTFARQVWLDTPHTSEEDPAQEWDAALDRAIHKYGGNNA
ncbi:bifunctional DNA primase/polymerase [Microbacterium istanbulense]|uniref:Bifunctional DNA primase/polymerase n=1 Tax=Microbacterium istanbulense TaxID=3122049 RepID=A0ABU8LNB7_9MICO